jgi:lysyl-tRNA synthetase class 2
VDVAQRRADMLARARHYFERQGVMPVDTPALTRSATSDPGIDSIAVKSRTLGDCFLGTSPEHHMKRLLAAGYPDIYSICRVYRDSEAGSRHAPEFTMAEWYRRGFDLTAMVDDTVRFIATCLDDSAITATVARTTYSDAVKRHAGADPLTAGVEELAACAAADERLQRQIGEDRDAFLDLIMGSLVAPALPADRLTVISHYPASQASLARLCPDDARVADRFEVYYGPLELANGYVELTDAAEQRRRIDADLERRKRLGRACEPWDRDLLAALEAGLPDCAGVAVGMERVHMVLEGAGDIADVMTFTEGRNDG